jgi:hypothetical protein
MLKPSWLVLYSVFILQVMENEFMLNMDCDICEFVIRSN